MRMKASEQSGCTVRSVFLNEVVVGAVAGLLLLGPGRALRAQPADWQLVPADDVPAMGTFASIQLSNLPPLPYNPFPELNVYWRSNTPLWLWVDDTGVDYAALRQQRQAARALRELESQYGLEGLDDLPPLPGGWEGEGEDPGPWPEGPETVYPEGSLWLLIGRLTNGVLPLVLTNTVPEELYEVLSKPLLTNGAWTSEAALMGATNQDWTPVAVSVGERTNSLFFWARSWTSYDGYGVPWAWYVEQGFDPITPGLGTQDVDADGLVNAQEYQWGSDPQEPEGFSVWVSSPAGYAGMP